MKLPEAESGAFRITVLPEQTHDLPLAGDVADLLRGRGRALSGGYNPSRISISSVSAEATAAGGRITIGVREVTLLQPPPGMSLHPRPGRYSVLEVADDGRGIEPGDLPRIFEPFFTSRPLNEGRGLGLSVVRGLVSSYGGGLLVDTAPGSGTRVSVYLPTAPNDPQDRVLHEESRSEISRAAPIG
jgi:Histidine kinase-, DNA gyrase B-, and HSP90-like ATPase